MRLRRTPQNNAAKQGTQRRIRDGSETVQRPRVTQPLADYRMQSLFFVERRLVRKRPADCCAILTASYRTAHETPD